jgi:phospholipid/cholesterol/gamma-HCH transport system substrate-binding protein
MSRRTLVNLVFFMAVFGVMLFWAVNNIVTIDRLERPYGISGEFEAAAGVRANSEVAYLGVHFGNVSSVERIPGGVHISMKIDRDRHIPEGSTARIFRKSAIGEPYIDFVPPEGYEGNDGPYIDAGDTVPMDHTTIPLEFSELLRSASRLVENIDPAKTNTLVHELAIGLVGRADSMRLLTQSSDELSAAFAERTDVLDRLATNNTRLTHVVTEHRGSLGESLTNLRLLSASLRNAQGDTSILLDRGSQLLTQTADIVGNEKQNLDCLLHDLEDVIDLTTTPARLNGTSTLLRQGGTAFGLVWQSRDEEPDGVWARTNLTAPTGSPATQYPPPGHELPPVPAVPPCASPLQPRVPGSDFVPTSVLRPSRPLPATAGFAVLALALIALFAAAGFRITGSSAAGTRGRR